MAVQAKIPQEWEMPKKKSHLNLKINEKNHVTSNKILFVCLYNIHVRMQKWVVV